MAQVARHDQRSPSRTAQPNNRILYRSSKDPNDWCMQLIRLLEQGGCKKYFVFDCYDQRNPPPGVTHFPVMYIVGMPELLVGDKAFEKAHELIAFEAQRMNMAQSMKIQYHQKRLMLQEQMTKSRDAHLLGFSDREMVNFSDTYSHIGNESCSLPQSFQTPLTNVADASATGDVIMVDSITTPQDLPGKMGADEQRKRIDMLQAERNRQQSMFDATWESERQDKLKQLTAAHTQSVPSQHMHPQQYSQQPAHQLQYTARQHPSQSPYANATTTMMMGALQ